MYFLHVLACYLRHTGHDYGDWQRSMGPNGYHIQYRVCRRCDWAQMPERFNDP